MAASGLAGYKAALRRRNNASDLTYFCARLLLQKFDFRGDLPRDFSSTVD